MTTGKKPDDHKFDAESEHEARLEQEELLAGMPELTPPTKLRYRQRAAVKRIVASAVAKDVFRDGDDGAEFDITRPGDQERLNALFDVCSDIDDFARSIATDPAVWDEWSSTKDEDTFIAVLTLYSDAVGESNGS